MAGAQWHNGSMRVLASLSLTLLLSAGLALAAPSENPWPRFDKPAPGPALAIGDYSAGCLRGAHELELSGPGYQVMRPSRLRYFGHPQLVDYIRALGKRVRSAGHGLLLIGDLSQPRGGRAAKGHASHQTGLDVDIWYEHPPAARRRKLTQKEREELSASSVVDVRADSVRASARPHVSSVLRLAASDARVDRVFVHPIIKRELCKTEAGERGWLRKIRPWYGHDDHFHVRLACPAGDQSCQGQAALPQGDGCDKLGWWFDQRAQEARKETKKAYQQTITVGRGWPEACDALLTDS